MNDAKPAGGMATPFPDSESTTAHVGGGPAAPAPVDAALTRGGVRAEWRFHRNGQSASCRSCREKYGYELDVVDASDGSLDVTAPGGWTDVPFTVVARVLASTEAGRQAIRDALARDRTEETER